MIEEEDVIPTIFVYGPNDDEAPRLGTFCAEDEAEAIAAANKLGWNWHKVAGRRVQELAHMTPLGDLGAGGCKIISIVERIHFDRFLCAAKIHGFDDYVDALLSVKYPKSRDEIDVDCQILTRCQEIGDDWYEGSVQRKIDADTFEIMLSWYEEVPLVVRKRSELGLMPVDDDD